MASSHVTWKHHKRSIQPHSQQTHAVYTVGPPQHCSSRCNAVSLRQQQQQLTLQLSDVLRDQQPDQVKLSVALVEQGAAALTASSDWQQLQQSFEHAARMHNAAASAAPHPQLPLAQVDANSNSNSSRAPARASAAAAGRSSPWGFALRQPRQAQTPQAAAPSCSSSRLAAAPPAASAPQGQQQSQWSWAAVQQLVVLGTGSIGKLRPCSTAAAEGPQPERRLGFRLFQLVVAKALQKALLPGLLNQPTIFDPDFDAFDQQLLAELGFEVLATAPTYQVTDNRGTTLLYMPCCPRDLYSTVLAANNGRLQQLAVFGTSMRSLADTEALLQGLTSSAAEPIASVTQQPGNMSVALTAAVEKSTEMSSSGNSRSAGSNLLSNSVQAVAGSQAAGATAATTLVELAYQQGTVIEVPCPDCAAHGVGVAVHLFSKQAVRT